MGNDDRTRGSEPADADAAAAAGAEGAPRTPGAPGTGGTGTGKWLTRRRALGLGAGVAVAGAVAVPVGWRCSVFDGSARAGDRDPERRSERRWSDADGWGGSVPRPGDRVEIRDAVLLDTDAEVAGLVIEDGGALRFPPSRSATLTSRGNVVLHGTLTLAPDRAEAVHRLVFDGVDERRFRGTAMEPEAGDIGLWVRGSGRLVLDGTPRTAWARAAGPLAEGARSVRLAARPKGWRAGDEVVVAPTAAPDTEEAALQYDLRTVESVDGTTVRLTEPLAHAHPAVNVGGGVVATAEVLNLTRNARVEGTRGGRTHIHVMSTAEQRVRHAALRWMGPRQAGEETWESPDGTKPITEGVTGRYALHFHMLGDATRGTVVDGVVVRDCGSHAFVPHNSHGITFRDCVSHDTWDDAYWWDGAPDTRTDQGPSDDLRWERCVASLVRFDPPFRGYRLTGFSLGAGRGSAARDCVAVGVQGSRSSSGYLWPEGGSGVWEFTGCVAHNNAADGIFTWQNNELPNSAEKFLAYHNGGHGIEHGAYLVDFTYRDCVLHGNGEGGILIHALSARKGTVFDNLLIDGAGLADHAVATTEHNLEGGAVRVTRCRMTGYRTAAVVVRSAGGAPDRIDIAACTFDGNELRFDDDVPDGARIRLRTEDGATLLVVPASADTGTGGALVGKWNARTSPTKAITGADQPHRTPRLRLPPISG